MKVAVLDINGKDTGRKAELSKDVFAIEPNNHAVYLDVKQYLANQRQGTHKAKERAEITGSTRKIKKQKGTGTARAGSIKSGVFRGGGRMFGPRPASDSFKLNKNVEEVLIYDITGKQIKAFKGEFTAGKTFDVSKLSRALYMVKIISNEGTATKRLLID